MPHLQQGAKVLGKKALQTGAQVAQDVLEGNNVNTALAKRSKEAIGGLVSQAGRGRKATKRKVHFRGFPPFKKRKTVVLDQDQDDFQLGRKMIKDDRYQCFARESHLNLRPKLKVVLVIRDVKFPHRV